jgi:hypothetical protein
MFALVSMSILKGLQITFHVFKVGGFQKIGCNFYFQILFQNGVNGGGKRGHAKKGRACSEIKSFKNNHMFIITSIEERNMHLLHKYTKFKKLSDGIEVSQKEGSCGTCIVTREGGME